MTTKQIGDLAEDLSVKILTDKEFDVICKNYRTRLGEIDIICFKRDTISFVEVKSLCMFKDNVISESKEQITQRKRNKLNLVAKHFISNKNLENYYYKFDLMEIKFWNDKNYSYSYIENIF